MRQVFGFSRHGVVFYSPVLASRDTNFFSEGILRSQTKENSTLNDHVEEILLTEEDTLSRSPLHNLLNEKTFSDHQNTNERPHIPIEEYQSPSSTHQCQVFVDNIRARLQGKQKLSVC